jgi:AcrR family transcriptional regulator
VYWNDHSKLGSTPLPSDKRQHILDATVALVCEDGVQASSMSRIARRAGVGMGTIYNYFDSKETLLGELYVAHGARLHDAIFGSWPEGAAPEEAFKHVWRSMVAHFEAHPDEFRFTERVRNASALPDAAKAERLAMWRRLDALFDDAMQQQVIGAVHLPAFLAMLHGAIGSYIEWRQTTGAAGSPETVEMLLEGFWRTLTATRGG